MEKIREATSKEIDLIHQLLKKAGLSLPFDWSSKLKVKPMDDGNMGSLSLFFDDIPNNIHGNTIISELYFKDKDEVDVIASLYANEENQITELDIWKTDYSPLIDFPDNYSEYI